MIAKTARNPRRKNIIDAIELMKQIAAETPADSIINQARKNLYETTVQSLTAELASINGGLDERIIR